jgi:hypothetical protein
MGDPIPLSHLLLEGLSQSLDALEAEILAAGHPIVIDYVGRRAVARDTARELIAQHQARLQAQADHEAAQAEHQAAERERAERQRAAEDRARQVRAERQRQLLRDNPGMSAIEVMLADNSDPDRTTPAGRRFDEIIAAERRGDLGTFHRISPQREA